VWSMGKSVHLFATIALALLASVETLLVLPIGPAQGAAAPTEPGFTDSPVVRSGLTNPTDMEFAPDGRLFVTEDAGKLRIAKPDGTLATFLNILTKLDSNGERGLLALTFDPNFSTNDYVYLHYTKKATSTTPSHNRIVRLTASGDRAVAGSEKLIFRLGNQTAATDHQGGALDFGKDGKLYISTGDNARGTVAQQLTNLFGKMLPINKSGTVPTDNPFYTTTSGSNRAIWALGLRNPFKFAVQPGTSNIFINDVGQDNWEEINRGAPGANYGWHICEGAHDYAGTPGEANCEAPPPYTPPFYEYPHEGDPLGSGCSITGGVFYPPRASCSLKSMRATTSSLTSATDG